MADQDAQDRNLPASAKKIEKSRAEGQLPRSRDLSHFAMMVAGGAVLSVGGPGIAESLQQMLKEALHFDAQMLAQSGFMTHRLGDLALHFLAVMAPIFGLMVAVAVASNIASGGWNWTLSPLAPKFSHLNPLTGIARLFSAQGLGQALKAVALAIVLATIGAMVLKNRLAAYVGIMTVPLPAALAYACQQLLSGMVLLGIALALFAAIDLPLQRALYLRRLRMSHEEVKQEHKQVEGNAEIKNKMRARMREIGKRRMLAAVPTADLVVMNPTHYAVALKYDEGGMAAPKVVAKGADLLALKIKELATDAKVPVLQSPVLARARYAHAEVDREMPAGLFGGVG